MKVYLIFPDIATFHGTPYHPGLASIAAVLIERGHEVKLGYLDSHDKESGILKQARDFNPDVVGFTAVESQFPYVMRLAPLVRKVKNCLIVCGGPYATLAPEFVLEKCDSIDAVIVGEGEYAMVEVLDKIMRGENWRSARNLAYIDKESRKLVRNPLLPLIEDLNLLPTPNTDIFPYQQIIDRNNIALFYFNRGCPYSCTYCSNTALGNVYGLSSNPIRYKTAKKAIAEIAATLAKYRLRDDTLLLFGDDLFVSNKHWLREFCDDYARLIKRPFWCTGRSNLITDEVCSLLRKAGCQLLMMSVESGNDYIRNEIMRRNISRDVLIRSFNLCHEHGINTQATCIVGLPFETVEMIEDSIKTVAALKSVTTYGINIFYPYKGTHLRRVCEEHGFMPADDYENFIERRQSILNLPDLSKDKILYYHKNWINLVMKERGCGPRLKYTLRLWWEALRLTYAGRLLRVFFNNTKLGKGFKRRTMSLLWNRGR